MQDILGRVFLDGSTTRQSQLDMLQLQGIFSKRLLVWTDGSLTELFLSIDVSLFLFSKCSFGSFSDKDGLGRASESGKNVKLLQEVDQI